MHFKYYMSITLDSFFLLNYCCHCCLYVWLVDCSFSKVPGINQWNMSSPWCINHLCHSFIVFKYYFNHVLLESLLCLLSFGISLCSNIWASNSSIAWGNVNGVWEYFQRPGGPVLPSGGPSHLSCVHAVSQSSVEMQWGHVFSRNVNAAFSQRGVFRDYHSLTWLTHFPALAVKFLSSLQDYCLPIQGYNLRLTEILTISFFPHAEIAPLIANVYGQGASHVLFQISNPHLMAKPLIFMGCPSLRKSWADQAWDKVRNESCRNPSTLP